MFRQACRYVRSLNLHLFDANNGTSIPCTSNTTPEMKREAFWELILFDTLYQILHDRPASLSTSDWAVDLPQPDVNSGPDGVNFTVFLVKSRVAFILNDFLRLVEEADKDYTIDVKARTAALCGTILELLAEHQIVGAPTVLRTFK